MDTVNIGVFFFPLPLLDCNSQCLSEQNQQNVTRHKCFVLISCFQSLRDLINSNFPPKPVDVSQGPSRFTHSLSSGSSPQMSLHQVDARKKSRHQNNPIFILVFILIPFWSSEISARVSSVKEEWRWRHHPLRLHLCTQTQHDYDFSLWSCRQNKLTQSNGRFVLVETLSFIKIKAIKLSFWCENTYFCLLFSAPQRQDYYLAKPSSSDSRAGSEDGFLVSCSVVLFFFYKYWHNNDYIL